MVNAGYIGYENQIIKGWLRKEYGRLPDCLFEPHKAQVDQSFVSAMVPPDDPWFFKCAVHYYDVFKHLNPFTIFVERSIDGCTESYVSKAHPNDPMSNWVEARATIKSRFEMMKVLQEQYGGVTVNTDQVIAGNFNTLEDAFELCRLELDYTKTAEAITI
jgi:hypothetical protein